ncbi:MAG: RagB/SusD family nutrient uptake outer membrane protein [Gemmatimonadaceae bacterium]
MISIRRAVTRTIAGVALLSGATACSDNFLKVTNPNVLDASTVDPVAGATTLALSAQQNFVFAYGWLSSYSAWFTQEANVSDTFPTRNEFGFRTISDLNGSLSGDVWGPISVAAASAKAVLDLTLPNPTSNINVARAATFRGFAVLMMATDFCTGALSSGPELTTAQLLDTAAFWFGKGIDAGKANGTTDGIALANAATVGRARAKLQKGDKAGAIADAGLVPAGFQFDVRHTDDAANRSRLSNRQYQFSFDRGSISVAPWYRQADTRIPYRAPGATTANGQDAVPGGFHQQAKFPGYGSAVRLASKLEADYIAAEAGGDVATMLTLINARRAAGGAPAYSGATDAASVTTELFNQRAIDFYLEGKRLADFRRNATATATTITASGQPYFKPGYGNVGTQTCYPIPRNERDNNPNMKTN